VIPPVTSSKVVLLEVRRAEAAAPGRALIRRYRLAPASSGSVVRSNCSAAGRPIHAKRPEARKTPR
jgi:hypothetical protein